MAKRDAIIYGLRAVLALAQHRPEAILRVLYLDELKMQIGPLLKATAANRKPYRVVEKSDLDRLCNTAHHEGVAVVATPFGLPMLTEVSALGSAKRLIALDDVENPHNVGAVARTAAWFGYDGLILRTDAKNLNPAAIRVSQGGVFALQCFRTRNLPGLLKRLAQTGHSVVGLTQRAPDIIDAVMPSDAFCLVLGNERSGLSKETHQVCGQKVRIGGSGQVESLNISVAAGIAMAHFIGKSFASS